MNYTIENIIPVDDQILVLLDKPHQVTTSSRNRKDESMQRELEFRKNKDNEGKEFIYEEDDFVIEKVKVNGRYRTGVVVAVPNYVEADRVRFEVGQRIVFEDGNQLPLDLLTSKVGDEKCPVLIRKFHVRAIIK